MSNESVEGIILARYSSKPECVVTYVFFQFKKLKNINDINKILKIYKTGDLD